MILPKRRQIGHQERFLAEPPINDALKRITLGDFYEELTATWLKAERLTTQKGIICPDIVHINKGITRFFEIKAVGARRQPTLFKDQIDAYAKWYPGVVYVFWFHGVDFDAAHTRDGIRREAAKETRNVVMVSLPRLMLLLDRLRAKPLKLRADGEAKLAYRVPIRVFKKAFMVGQTKLFHAVKLRDYWVGTDWPIGVYEAV